MKRRLVEVAWEITDKCNYNCIHCYNPKQRIDLTYEEILQILNELKGLGIEKIKYGGGEPLLRKDFLDILRNTLNNGFDTTFSTNGYIINEELVSKIKETGLSRIQVSLDGNKEVHNHIRQNAEAYEKAINAIKLFVNKGFKVSVATTLMKSNLDCLDNLFEVCSDLGVNRWRVMKYIPSLRVDLTPDLKEYRKAHEELIRLRNSSVNMEVFVAREFDEICESTDRFDSLCFGGRSVVSIKANGDVSPCSYIPNMFGNLREKSLAEIWDRDDMKDFASESYGDKNCKHFNLCQGGCKAASFYASGKQRCDPYCWVKED